MSWDVDEKVPTREQKFVFYCQESAWGNTESQQFGNREGVLWRGVAIMPDGAQEQKHKLFTCAGFGPDPARPGFIRHEKDPNQPINGYSTYGKLINCCVRPGFPKTPVALTEFYQRLIQRNPGAASKDTPLNPGIFAGTVWQMETIPVDYKAEPDDQMIQNSLWPTKFLGFMDEMPRPGEPVQAQAPAYSHQQPYPAQPYGQAPVGAPGGPPAPYAPPGAAPAYPAPGAPPAPQGYAPQAQGYAPPAPSYQQGQLPMAPPAPPAAPMPVGPPAGYQGAAPVPAGAPGGPPAPAPMTPPTPQAAPLAPPAYPAPGAPPAPQGYAPQDAQGYAPPAPSAQLPPPQAAPAPTANAGYPPQLVEIAKSANSHQEFQDRAFRELAPYFSQVNDQNVASVTMLVANAGSGFFEQLRVA